MSCIKKEVGHLLVSWDTKGRRKFDSSNDPLSEKYSVNIAVRSCKPSRTLSATWHVAICFGSYGRTEIVRWIQDIICCSVATVQIDTYWYVLIYIEKNIKQAQYLPSNRYLCNGLMVIVVRNEYGDSSSNPGRGLFPFHVALIDSGKVWIPKFSLQPLANISTDWGSWTLIWLPISEKENSEFNPDKLHLNIDLMSHPTRYGLFSWVLWHINHCRLINAKSSLYIYIEYIGFGLVGFYGISTTVSYLMPNPLYTYILNI